MSKWRSFKKVELHRHMEGSVRLQTVLDVASEAGVVLPSRNIEVLRKYACVTSPMENLAVVLDKFWLVQSVLATPGIIERVAYENCIDAFNDGIRVLELRYSPSFMSVNHPELTYDSIHQAVLAGVSRAQKELKDKIAVGLICIITRDQPFTEAEKTADFAIENKDTFVGFDLAGDEAISSSVFAPLFKKVAHSGIKITVHSGEANVLNAPQLLRQTIEELQPARIGHGVQVINDLKIIEFVKQSGVVLELCPTSNLLTKAVGNILEHPLKKLLDMGVKVTLNSDDPHLFCIDLTHEYETMATHHGMGVEEFNLLNSIALKASFISPEKIKKAWDAAP
ncbi:MAG: adenosine deaminase [Oligoflexia bacterium]|nr:adenosine deaminase [Oligoflexia bacterium]